MNVNDMSDRQLAQETLERCRRIETRVVRGLEQLGAEPVISRPSWRDGVVYVPSPEASLASCLATVPDSWPPGKPVEVYCKNDYLTTIAH